MPVSDPEKNALRINKLNKLTNKNNKEGSESIN